MARSGDCSTCGLAVELHFDAGNRMTGCVGAAKALSSPVDRGRLFGFKIRKNYEARQAALATIRERPDGQWQAKVGGAVRGHVVVERTRRRVEEDVNDHYNNAMHDFVVKRA